MKNDKINKLFKRINKNGNSTVIDTKGCPEVIIKDKNLAVTLGQWLEYLPDSIKTTAPSFSVITSMSADELLKRRKITKDDLENINKYFSQILKQAGFGEGNTCVLNQFNEENLSFVCSFDNTGEEAFMRIKFGFWLDNGPELIINFDGIESVYNYWCYSDKPSKLELQSSIENLDNEGRKYYRYISPYTYYADVYNDDYRLYVQIEYPDKSDDNNSKTYINEEVMKEQLTQITFPADLEDICRRVASGLNVDSKEYPTISIKVKKKLNDKKDLIVDEALYQNGMLIKLIITKNGKTITLSNFEQWSYTTEDYTVSQLNDKSVSYGFKSMPIEKLSTMPTPQEMIDVAAKDVENVRVLAKTLLNSKKEK